MAVEALTNEHAQVDGTSLDWRRALPELSDEAVMLREVRSRDAPSLLAHLNHPQVVRYVAPCPTTVEGFRRFIRWARRERRRGMLACFGLVPKGEKHVVAVLQVW